ncbi:MAG: hypothetical protein LBC92_03115 [Rickettsiales bacterium]|jgi:hypothetical protein|nr:hypothetical protein [Rickettsiales bacterium]
MAIIIQSEDILRTRHYKCTNGSYIALEKEYYTSEEIGVLCENESQKENEATYVSLIFIVLLLSAAIFVWVVSNIKRRIQY